MTVNSRFFYFCNNISSAHFSIFFLFCCCFCPCLLKAQALNSDSTLLNTVVIQATRMNNNSPVPHTNLGADEIARQYHAQDIPFLLSAVPSLVETSDAGAGVGYTGMRIRGSDPTRISVTINGVPFNDAESQGVFWVNMPDLAASAAEIQVQRGVGSSTNGSGSFGATVNIDLSKVHATPFAQITNTIGSFGMQKHALQWATGVLPGGKISFSGRLSTIRSNGYVDRASAQLRGMHLTGTYTDDRQSLQMHFIGGREITYQAWYGLPAQYYDAGSPRTFNAAGTERIDIPHPNEVDNYNQRHYLAHYKINVSPRAFLQVNGHYTRGFGYYEQYKANALLADYNMPNVDLPDTSLTQTDLIRQRWLDNHFYGTTWAFIYTPGKTTYTFGGGANQYRGQHFGSVVWANLATLPYGNRYYDNKAKKNDLNAYLKVETNWNRKFSSLLDLQIRQVDYRFLGFNNQLENIEQTAKLLFFNPKVGANYRLRPTTSLYLFAGVGHREPNRDDYTQSSPDSRPKAERLYNIETGLKSNHQQWGVTLNGFGMIYRNQLVLNGQINDVGGYIRTNIAQSYRLGVELEGIAKPISKLKISANLSFSTNKALNFTEYRDNWSTGAQESILYKKSDLAFSPNVIGRAEITYLFTDMTRKHAWSATVIAKYISRQYLDNTANAATQLPAYHFFDGRVNYDFRWGNNHKIQIIGTVANLFNARYVSNGWVYRFVSPGYDPRPDDAYTRQEQGDLYHQAGYFPQAGRNYMLTAVVLF